jgi:O-acetyl-ADP-ribose deacetylase (regulator of RNase III)
MTKRVRIHQTVLELVQGNIIHQDTGAIVNAANTSLLGGGGVDGAIHRAAGPQLLEETRTLNGCKTGDAKISKGYNLKAKYVIHAVGPFYNSKNKACADLLASAYRRSLEVAVENGVKTIAFPAISTGAYRYPLDEAATIALETVYAFVTEQRTLTLIRFVLFTDTILAAFSSALDRLIQQHPESM